MCTGSQPITTRRNKCVVYISNLKPKLFAGIRISMHGWEVKICQLLIDCLVIDYVPIPHEAAAGRRAGIAAPKYTISRVTRHHNSSCRADTVHSLTHPPPKKFCKSHPACNQILRACEIFN